MRNGASHDGEHAVAANVVTKPQKSGCDDNGEEQGRHKWSKQAK